MDRIRSAIKLRIHVENDQLIMHGIPSESAGCVLRGVLEVCITEPTKVKSITLMFTGTISIVLADPSKNGREERSILQHKWPFLPKEDGPPHPLDPGRYTYEFELPLAGNLPETTHVESFYTVEYCLKATVERPRFKANRTAQRTIYLVRQMLPLSVPSMDPVQISDQWNNLLDYNIALTSKIYTLRDKIALTIRATSLVSGLRVRQLVCTLKEYTVCHSRPGWQENRPRTHSRVLFFKRDEKFAREHQNDDSALTVWLKQLSIPIPSTLDQVQYDMDNDLVRVRHKVKVILSVENHAGQVSELRTALPVYICAVNTVGLPAYEDTWQTLPYDPMAMLASLHHDSEPATTPSSPHPSSQSAADLPSYSTLICGMTSNEVATTTLPHLPTYDESLCLFR